MTRQRHHQKHRCGSHCGVTQARNGAAIHGQENDLRPPTKLTYCANISACGRCLLTSMFHPSLSLQSFRPRVTQTTRTQTTRTIRKYTKTGRPCSLRTLVPLPRVMRTRIPPSQHIRTELHTAPRKACRCTSAKATTHGNFSFTGNKSLKNCNCACLQIQFVSSTKQQHPSLGVLLTEPVTLSSSSQHNGKDENKHT